jgi:hypothetical protein
MQPISKHTPKPKNEHNDETPTWEKLKRGEYEEAGESAFSREDFLRALGKASRPMQPQRGKAKSETSE